MINETAVILLAGGSGSRLGGDQAKQFVRVAGKPVLCHSFQSLRKFMPDSVIVVVVPIECTEKVKSMLIEEHNFIVISGGSNRQASTMQGLKALLTIQPKNVLIHDAARPFISGQIINDVLNSLIKHEAIDVAIPTNDTIIIERNGFIQNIPKRQNLLRGQTPQAFRFKLLINCYNQIGEERLSQFTDDCGIFLECYPKGLIRIVKGNEENIKITNPIDLVLADELYRIRTQNFNSDFQGIDIRDKNALIYGGNAGIGKALAQVMSDAGANVISLSRTNGCDITNIKNIETSLQEAKSSFDQIDFVINSTGFLKVSRLTELSFEEISNQIQINLTAALWLAKASYPYLKESKGMLLNFASSSFTRGRANYATYTSTKAAIVNLTQALSEEWHPDQIRVNCIVPGRTDTKMRRVNFNNEIQSSLCNPYEVALTSAKLLSRNTTGEVVRI